MAWMDDRQRATRNSQPIKRRLGYPGRRGRCRGAADILPVVGGALRLLLQRVSSLSRRWQVPRRWQAPRRWFNPLPAVLQPPLLLCDQGHLGAACHGAHTPHFTSRCPGLLARGRAHSSCVAARAVGIVVNVFVFVVLGIVFCCLPLRDLIVLARRDLVLGPQVPRRLHPRAPAPHVADGLRCHAETRRKAPAHHSTRSRRANERLSCDACGRTHLQWITLRLPRPWALRGRNV